MQQILYYIPLLLSAVLPVIAVYFALKIRKQNQTVEEKKAQFEASINSFSAGFVMTDKTGQIISINGTAKRIFCSDPTEENPVGIVRSAQILSKDCSIGDIAKRLEGKLDIHDALKKCLQGSRIEVSEVSIGDRFYHIYLAPVGIPEKTVEVIGCIILIEDITEAKLLEKSKTEFFSIASHELRTPLTAIRGNTSLIKEYFWDKITDQGVKEAIEDIHSSSVRLIEIVNDFLDTSRLEQGRIEFKAVKFELVELIGEVIKELSAISQQKNLYLKFDSTNMSQINVWADRNRVKQVLINLIGNALKFTESGGITIKLGVINKMLKVSVIDTGKGISDENKKLLFRKFQQAEDNFLTRDATRGTGLGLYISKLLIEGMGGKIELEFSEISKGTTFYFTLQLADNQQIIAPVPQAIETPSLTHPVDKPLGVENVVV